MAMKNAAKILSLECSRLAETVADRHGFVSLRALAERCGCQIVVRPLLVEAGITKRLDGDSDWIVLVNDEIHPISDEQIEYESHLSPIAARTRNTIAHEIAHAIAIETFGIDFSTADSNSEKLKDIERAIENASPLLLISGKKLLARLEIANDGGEAIEELVRSTELFGISKNALFTAFRHVSKYKRSRFLANKSINSGSWGIAERKGKNRILTRSYWLMSNYHGATSSPFIEILLSENVIEWTIDSHINCGISSILSISREVNHGLREVVVMECEKDLKSSGIVFFHLPHCHETLSQKLELITCQ